MRRADLIFAIFFVGCVGWTSLPAQSRGTYSFRHISQADGLLGNAVISITQDNRGFMWICTENGLQRYDGTRFVNYQNELDTGDKSNFSGYAFYRGQDNRLLLELNNKLKSLDLLTNNIAGVPEEDMTCDTSRGSGLYFDEHHDPWALGRYRVYYYDRTDKGLHWFAFRLGGNAADDSIHGQTWVTNGGDLFLFDSASRKLCTHKYNPLGNAILRTPGLAQLKGVFIDKQHHVWINAWSDNLFKYDPDKARVEIFSLDSIRRSRGERNIAAIPSTANYLFQDDRGIIWVATAGAGLLRYDEAHDDFAVFKANNSDNESIHYNFEIYCIFQDRDENIWIGTDRGISIFNPYRQYFMSFPNDEDGLRSFPKREINCVIQTRQGDILVGTWGGGMAIFDHELHFKKNFRFSGAPEANLLWCFMQQDDGTIWIGCQHGYLHVYDPVKNSYSTIHPPELMNSTIRCMCRDNLGNILFGLHNGKVAVWSKKEKRFYAYRDTLTRGPSAFNPVYALYSDPNGISWVSTEKGLRKFDIGKMAYTGAYYPGKDSTGHCLDIEKYNDSNLLIGIVNAGIVLFNKYTGEFQPFRMREVQPSVTIDAIHKDGEGNIWFASDYGLHKLLPSGTSVTYNISSAAIGSSFLPHGFLILRDGRWLIATMTQIVAFDPDSLNREQHIPLPVEIAGMKVFDKSVFIDSFFLKREPITLGYLQNFITFEFAALVFSGAEQVAYRYKLSGIDKDWVSANRLRSASYTNLLPGEYIFSVKAERGGIEGEAAFIKFIIKPPFWGTWWFRTGIAMLAVCLVYWFMRRRIKVIRRESALKQQIAETEMMALRAQMNPHFIFNCINSIDALIQSNDKYQATVYLNKFAKLIRNILDSSKQNTVTLAKDLETLKLYIELEQFRQDNRFTYELHADASLLQDDYKVPPLIIQPYVENAILHGLRPRPDNEGRLFISVSRQNGHLTYIIEDNGVGRHVAEPLRQAEKRSYGIPMSNDRIKLFNRENRASVEIVDLVSNGQPAGTMIRVTLKIQ